MRLPIPLVAILTFAAITFASANGAFARTCESIFAEASDNPGPMAAVIESQIRDRGVTPRSLADDKLAARLREAQARNFLWSMRPLPEMRPFISDMSRELGKVNRRLRRAGTPWLLRHLLNARVQYMKLSVKAAGVAPTYRGTLELAFRFSALMSVVEEARGLNEFEDNSLADRILARILNRTLQVEKSAEVAIRAGELTGATVLPTFSQLSIPRMNRLWARRIFPVGFVGRTSNFDGNQGTFIFPRHDIDHIKQLIAAHTGVYFELFGSRNNSRAHQEALNRLKINLLKSEKIDVPILEELDRYALTDTVVHPTLNVKRSEIEELYFLIRHERYLLPTTQSFDAELGGMRQLWSERDRSAMLWLIEKWIERGIELPTASVAWK